MGSAEKPRTELFNNEKLNRPEEFFNGRKDGVAREHNSDNGTIGSFKVGWTKLIMHPITQFSQIISCVFKLNLFYREPLRGEL